MSRFLLDTSVFIKAAFGELDKTTWDLIRDEDLILSSISVLEIAIKDRVKKLDFPSDLLNRAVRTLDVEPLPYRADHALRLYTMPVIPQHKDPFDRALIATALVEGLQLITTDQQFHHYRAFGLQLIEAR